MIKEAIEKVLSLAVPVNVEVGGRQYSTVKLEPCKAPLPPKVVFHSLSGLRDYLLTFRTRDAAFSNRDFHVSVDSPTCVSVISTCEGVFNERVVLAQTSTTHDEFPFGRYLDQEEFVIALQTQFVQDDMLRAVLGVAGNLSAASDVNVADDGLTQKVTIQLGVVQKSTVAVTNPVTLKPYRTFLEVDQAPCQLVLRFRKGGKDGGAPQCALFEADGGLWKIKAMENCAAWLSGNGVADVLC
jgi:hypothetical protein